MPVLDFKGKSIIYSHHLGVPFCDLRVEPKKSLPAKGKKPSLEDNLIIHGDNLWGLKSLLPRYARKIKCIYIDPPYNTGNEGWKYNDNVNNTLIKEWISKEVGTDDLERHDKWLCMMWPRLQLLKELLSDDGVIFTSIDDNEQHRLRLMMDETFGDKNFIASLIRKTGTSVRMDASFVSKEHDYILLYAKDIEIAKLNKEISSNLDSYPYQDQFVSERGSFKLNKLDRGSIKGSESLCYGIESPDGSILYPGDGRKHWYWRWSEAKFKMGLKNDFLVFKKVKGKWSVYFKQYQYVNNNLETIERKWPYKTLLTQGFKQ